MKRSYVFGAILLMGCGPPIAGPPPVPLGENESFQISTQATYIDTIGAERPRPPAGDLLQAQFSTTFANKSGKLHISPLLSFGGKQAFRAVGVLGRYQLAEEAGNLWQVHASGGLSWVDVGASWTRELGKTSIYTAPSIGFRDSFWMRLPVGARADLGFAYLDLETGLTASSTMLSPDRAYGPETYGYISLGLSKGFPERETKK